MNYRKPPALATWMLDHLRSRGKQRGALGRSIGSILHRSFCGLVLVSGHCGNRNSLGPEPMAPPHHIVFCRCMVGREASPNGRIHILFGPFPWGHARRSIILISVESPYS